MTQDDTETRILNLLENEGVMTTLEISEKLKISRNTAAKYLSILLNKYIVQAKEAGPAKLWSRTNTNRYQQPFRRAPFNEIFAEAIDKALEQLFGTPTKQAVYFHLYEGATMEQMLEKPELLHERLERFFGMGASLIEGAILVELSRMTGYRVKAQDVQDLNLASYIEHLPSEAKKKKDKLSDT